MTHSAVPLTCPSARCPFERCARQGRVLGAGLTQVKTPHALEIAGKQLYTWCAVDALAFPIILGVDARVASRCAASDRPVEFFVGPQGVRDLRPAEAVMTIPAANVTASDLRSKFCARSSFFRSNEVALGWPKLVPGLEVVGVASASELAVPVIQRLVLSEAVK
jgi:alkylmercury lyase